MTISKTNITINYIFCKEGEILHFQAESISKNGYLTKLIKKDPSKCPLLSEKLDSIVAIPFDKEKGFLMVYNRNREGWEFPAGRIEPLESPSMALKRELAEECGLSLRNIKKVFFWRSYIINDESSKSEGIIYIVEIENTENLIPIDIEEISKVEFKKILPRKLGFKDGFIEYVFKNFLKMWEEVQLTK